MQSPSSCVADRHGITQRTAYLELRVVCSQGLHVRDGEALQDTRFHNRKASSRGTICKQEAQSVPASAHDVVSRDAP